jgi:hypothetical protein
VIGARKIGEIPDEGGLRDFKNETLYDFHGGRQVRWSSFFVTKTQQGSFDFRAILTFSHTELQGSTSSTNSDFAGPNLDALHCRTENLPAVVNFITAAAALQR